MKAINVVKKCSKCGEIKPVSEFFRNKNQGDGFLAACKKCKKIIDHEYYEKNKDYIIKNNTERAKNNRAKVNKRRNYMYKNNPQRRLSELLRTRLGKVISRWSNDGSSIQDIGCSADELKEHIESMFKDGMSWENHGKEGWHIDHIVPLSSFDLTDREQFLAACNYKNIQPLWAKDNLSKGAKNEIH